MLPNHSRGLRLLLAALALIGLALVVGTPTTEAQETVAFENSGLQGENLNNPTSLQFGPDGRLYVSQQNGVIQSYTIVRTTQEVPDEDNPGETKIVPVYTAVDTETINIVQQYVPNHNDDGTPISTQKRQVTGIYVTGTATNPVLYVSSSDDRIGAGGGGNDVGLDTNSGVISRLICTGGMVNGECSGWEKVDLVRGLPRSEENHSVNGIQMDETANILYVAVGGHANAGAPSNNFAFTTEYAYSAAIISVDLTDIEGRPIQEDTSLYSGYTYKWVYDLPTLDDPTRNNIDNINDPNDPNYTGVDPNDPFGGNDGLNQAKIDPNSPVQIYADGFRNLYDIVLLDDGTMYGVDNGANQGWGGHPVGEIDYPVEYPGYDPNNPATIPTMGTCTNDYIVVGPNNSEPGGDNGFIGPGGDPVVNNKNGLHYIRPLQPGDFNYVDDGQPYYGGHPAPVRGNVSAGLYTKGSHTVDPDDGGDDYWRDAVVLDGNGDPIPQYSLPVDWPPVPASLVNPANCDFRQSGLDDNSLANYGPSTNGIAMYTSSVFPSIQGDLLLAAFNGNIYHADLNEDGDMVVNCLPDNFGGLGTSELPNCTESLLSNFGSTPLDVIAQGDNDPFPGTIWAATYGSDNITVFEPDPELVCEGTDDPALDEDLDGYSNADEIDNGSNPCSGGSRPSDFDQATENGFLVSNLNDPDDDNDGILDVDDPFQLDCSNGVFSSCNDADLKAPAVTVPFGLELFNATSYGIGDIGFTGLMTDGSTQWLDLIDDSGDELIYGGTAGLYTDPSVSEGDAYQNTNSQKNGFQFGLDVDANTKPFTVYTQINSPFFSGQTPGNFQSQGIQIGAGDQDNYFKFVLKSGGFELLHEESGSKVGGQSYSVPNLLNQNAILLYLSINPATGEIEALYGTAEDGPRTSVATYTLPAGNVLDAVQGNNTINGNPIALAVGPIATSFGPAPEFGATWDYFRAEENPSDAKAFVSVGQAGIDSSTEADTSFLIRNDSVGGEQIDKVTIDLSTAAIAELVFDPNDGTPAGDTATTDFTVSASSDSTGESASFSGATEDGFAVLEIDFTEFAPNEQIQFGIDIDPVSIKGSTAPGPNNAGNVSGLELAGTTVTVEYSTGETQTVELFGEAANPGSSQNTVRTALPGTPTIDMIDVDNKTTTFTAEQDIVMNAPLGVDVRLLQLEAGLFVEGDGYNVNDWEVNSVIAVQEYTASTSAENTLEFDVTLTNSDPAAGYNIFAAAVVDEDGATGPLSNIIIVKYDPNAQPVPIYRINAGGNTITATDDGPNWIGVGDGQQSGDGWAVNTGNTSTHNISGRDASVPDYVPQVLYTTEKWDQPAGNPMQWTFDVDNGMYDVNLLMGNGFGGTSEPGERVFDVSIEDELVLNDLDLSDKFGHQVGGMESFVVEVNDGELNILFEHVVENPTVNAIEILQFGGSVNPPGDVEIQIANIADQTNVEGNIVSVILGATGGDGTLTYDAGGTLPPGLSVDGNGVITGTIATGAAANSPYNVSIVVDDSDADTGDTKTVNFQWTVTEPVTTAGQVLHRVNVGGPELAAADSSLPAWSQDQGNFPSVNNSPFLAANSDGNSLYTASAGSAHAGPVDTTSASIPASVPDELFNTERYDAGSDPEMLWQFPLDESGTALPSGQYEVRLYFAELFGQITAPGQRVFDVEVEGVVPPTFDDIDSFAIGGAKGAFMLSATTAVSDGTLDIEFIHGVAENPALKGIEVILLETDGETPIQVDPIANLISVEGDGTSDYLLDVVATGGDGNLNYSIAGQPADVQVEPTNGQIFGTIAAGASAGGPNSDGVYNVTVTVDDSDTNPDDAVEINFVWTVQAPVTGTEPVVLFRVNAGGPEVASDIPDKPWMEDQKASGNPGGNAQNGTPSPYYVNPQDADTTFGASFADGTNDTGVPDVLFATERFSEIANPNNMQWEFPVANGEYIVNLYFAELWSGASNPGVRVFDVEVEDVVVIDDLDQADKADVKVAFVETINTTVTDGVLDIDFIKGAQNPTIKALEILQVPQDTDTNTPPTIATIADVTVTEGDTITVADITASDVDVDDTLTLSIAITDDSDSSVVADTEYTFTDDGNGTADFEWITEVGDSGSYTATVTADDGTDQTTATFAVTINEAVISGEPLVCINVGGVAVEAFGRTFVGDNANGKNTPYFLPVEAGVNSGAQKFGSPGNDTLLDITALDGTDLTGQEEDLFQSERFGGVGNNTTDLVMTMELDGSNLPGGQPLPAGDYIVDLYFAEIFVGVQGSGTSKGAGDRIFDVTMEDNLILDDYDLFTVPEPDAPLKAITVTETATVTDGGLTIVFDASVDNAKVSAVCVTPAETNQPPTITPIDDVTYGILAEFNAGRFTVEATDPNVGDTLTYSADGLPSTLSIDSSGEIIGTIDAAALTGGPNSDGVYPVTITVSDGNLDATENFTLTVIDRTLTLITPVDGSTIAPTDALPVSWTSTGGETDPNYFDHVHVYIYNTDTNAGINAWLGSQLLQDSIVIDANTKSEWANGVLFDANGFLLPGNYAVEIRHANPSHVEYDTSIVIPAIHTFTVEETAPVVGSALVEITPGGGLGASTFGNNSFQFTHTGGVDDPNITSISIDLSTGILPDMVFDPVGAGGDATSNCVTANSGAVETGITIPADDDNNGPTDVDCVEPFSQPRNGGFDVMTLEFTDFNPGESFFFKTDIDPNSIQGVPGAGNAGAVSGYELVGATITVTFEGGSTLTSSLYEDGSLGGGQAVIAADAPATPSIALDGMIGNITAATETPTITVTGTPGANVSLLQMDSRLYIASGNPPFDVTTGELPFYANEAMSGKTLYSDVIGANGTVAIPVTLLETAGASDTPDGGINQFVAVLSDSVYAADQQVSMTSNVLTVIYDPTAQLASLTGTVTRQGKADHSGDLSVKVYEVGAASPAYTFTPTADAAGQFTITGIAPGTYEVAVKYANTLQVVETVTLVTGSNSANFGEMLAGDINDDNSVDALDLSILLPIYNTQAGDTGYNPMANITGAQDIIDALDLSLLIANYNIAGEMPSGAN